LKELYRIDEINFVTNLKPQDVVKIAKEPVMPFQQIRLTSIETFQ